MGREDLRSDVGYGGSWPIRASERLIRFELTEPGYVRPWQHQTL
ncbi:MAG: hypothetical protein PVJ76_12500 [Gemmatimonadota bacterium]